MTIELLRPDSRIMTGGTRRFPVGMGSIVAFLARSRYLPVFARPRPLTAAARRGIMRAHARRGANNER